MEFPVAFMGFDSNASYIDVCEYCSAFDIDTLKLFLNGCNCLCFYSINDFEACCFYCNLRSFHVKKYVLLQVWILFIEKENFARDSLELKFKERSQYMDLKIVLSFGKEYKVINGFSVMWTAWFLIRIQQMNHGG